MILETSFIIDFMRGNENAVRKMKELIDSNNSISIASPTIFELFSGLEQSSMQSEELDKIHKIIHNQLIWQFDDSSAEIAGRIHGYSTKNNSGIDPIDAMIAGIAIKHNEKILTKNIKHFSKISNLKIENY